MKGNAEWEGEGNKDGLRNRGGKRGVRTKSENKSWSSAPWYYRKYT